MALTAWKTSTTPSTLHCSRELLAAQKTPLRLTVSLRMKPYSEVNTGVTRKLLINSCTSTAACRSAVYSNNDQKPCKLSECLPAVNNHWASPSPLLYSTDVINDLQDGPGLKNMAILRPIKYLKMGHSVEFSQFSLEIQRTQVLHHNTALLRFLLWSVYYKSTQCFQNRSFVSSHLGNFYEEFPHDQGSFLAIFGHNLHNIVPKLLFSSAALAPVRVAQILLVVSGNKMKLSLVIVTGRIWCLPFFPLRGCTASQLQVLARQQPSSRSRPLYSSWDFELQSTLYRFYIPGTKANYLCWSTCLFNHKFHYKLPWHSSHECTQVPLRQVQPFFCHLDKERMFHNWRIPCQ